MDSSEPLTEDSFNIYILLIQQIRKTHKMEPLSDNEITKYKTVWYSWSTRQRTAELANANSHLRIVTKLHEMLPRNQKIINE